MILTANQKRALRHLWKGELTSKEIAEEMGFSDEQLAAAAAALSLPEREDPDVYLPTPQQIRWATAQIRATWTQSEREARLCAAWSVRLSDATGNDTNALRSSTDRRCEGGSCRGTAR